MREERHLHSIWKIGCYGLWGFFQKQWKRQKVQCGLGVRRAWGAGKGRRAGRDGAPQFMIAPCQSVNERTPLLFIEITLAIDGCAVIDPLLIASPDLACPFIPTHIFCSQLSCRVTIINRRSSR